VGIAERYALVALLIAVVLLFTFLPATSSTFMTAINVRQVLVNQSVIVILAIGLLYPLILGSFDISVGALAGLCAVVTATAMSRFSLPVAAAIAIGIAAGLAVGVVNAVLIAIMQLNAFIVTLGMSTLLTGLVTWYTNGNNISNDISPGLVTFGNSTWAGIPGVLYLVAVVVLVGWYTLGHTPFGRYVHAVGSNKRAAQLVGIRVTRMTFICFLVSGGLAGVAGVAMVATSGGAVVSEGPSLLFPVLTAVFLSATTINTGRYNVAGTVVGVLLIASAVSGLNLAGAENWVEDVFDGGALVVAVAISTYLARQRRRAGAGKEMAPPAEEEGRAFEELVMDKRESILFRPVMWYAVYHIDQKTARRRTSTVRPARVSVILTWPGIQYST
jgi:ribose transport system permease protein